jgi:hypothetical protein
LAIYRNKYFSTHLIFLYRSLLIEGRLFVAGSNNMAPANNNYSTPPKTNGWVGTEADPRGFHSQHTAAADSSNRVCSRANETALEARLTFRNDRDRDLFTHSPTFQSISPADRDFLIRAAQRANARIVYDAPQTERPSEDVAGLVKKIEFSPNSLAKCKSCHKKIEKKSERIGIPGWYAISKA